MTGVVSSTTCTVVAVVAFVIYFYTCSTINEKSLP